MKPVENRTWRTSHRGPLLIQAGSTIDPDGEQFCRDLGHEPTSSPRGVALCIVDVVDCVRDSSSPWAFPGCWHWILRNPRLVDPMRMRGMPGLFRAPAPIADLLRDTAGQLA